MGRPDAWGAGGVRQRTSDSNWKKPARWERLAQRGLLPDGKTAADHRPRVFCASLADVFEPRPELEQWRHDLVALIEQTPSLDWLILTKRPEEARDWLRAWYTDWTTESDGAVEHLFSGSMTDPAREWVSRDRIAWGVLPNIWIGTSIENSRFTWRADVLREIPAAVRFISAEPLLGSLFERGKPKPGQRYFPSQMHSSMTSPPKKPLDLTGIDWLIVGGESGSRDARPMHPDWARELRDACLDDIALAHHLGCIGNCAEYGCPIPEQIDRPAFFFKQWGSWAPRGFVSGISDVDDRPKKRIVGDPYADPEEGGVTWDVCYYGAGPKSAGKLLDNREWCEFPESRALVPA